MGDFEWTKYEDEEEYYFCDDEKVRVVVSEEADIGIDKYMNEKDTQTRCYGRVSREIQGLVGWKIDTFIGEEWHTLDYMTSLTKLNEQKEYIEKRFGINIELFEQVANEMIESMGVSSGELIIVHKKDATDHKI